MSGRKTWIASGVLIGTLLVGVFIGSASTVVVLKKKFNHHKYRLSSVEMRKDGAKAFMLERMRRLLDLNETQVEAVGAELETLSQRFHQLHESTRVELEALVTQGNKGIKQHLTPAQAKLFDEKFKKGPFGKRGGYRRDSKGGHQPPLGNPDPHLMGPPPPPEGLDPAPEQRE